MLRKETDSSETNESVLLSHKILGLNKKLIESEKAKSRFLSLITRELNNSMTALLGLIPHFTYSDSESEKIFSLVHQETLFLDFRIQNLVSAAEIERGEVDINYEAIDVESVIKEVIEDLKYTIESKDIMISIHNTITDTIVSDPRKLYLIVKNMVANGCIYGFANDIVDISITESSSTLKIAVNNQGYPPKVEFKSDVFTRFAKGPEGEHGLGIGLSVIQELCEQLGGSIDYVATNRWVTFTVTLPLMRSIHESDVYSSNELLFEPIDQAIEL